MRVNQTGKQGRWTRQRERRLASNMCAACGVRPQVEGYKSCQQCRDRARLYMKARYRRMVGRPVRSKDNSPDAAIDATPGCVRCGLRGEHECLRGNAFDCRGPGRTLPEGGI